MLIALILYLLRRFHMVSNTTSSIQRQRIKMKQADRRGSEIALDTTSPVFLGNNRLMGIKNKGCQMTVFNPYENLFMEIDPKLKIPLDELEFGAEIGKGISVSIVTLHY
ncbi:unnamed protein product [Gongylonema pulchrum]|uniref:Phosphatidylserine decarboxylase n=1 Tax=Gongylonema pulchrum TaxID=637853 RepID=A0A183DG03_9BILA|nr:unnamed protein product [Gongylonema pulchrum]